MKSSQTALLHCRVFRQLYGEILIQRAHPCVMHIYILKVLHRLRRLLPGGRFALFS